jgi:hypothetical protein
LKGSSSHDGFIGIHRYGGGALTNQDIIRGLLFGFAPVVFLTCGIYAGIVYGVIVGAVRAGRSEPQPIFQWARIIRSSVR